MVNKEKALKREITRLRKTQNPQQTDLLRERRLRSARTEIWKLREKPLEASVMPEKEKKAKTPKKEKPKKIKKTKEKEPELEVLEEEPEIEKVDADIDDLYTYDEDIDEE